MWDTVPWFVGGGAQHSPEVARLFAFAATSGAEGIISPGDLKIAPLDVPGSSVRALSGACIINSDAAGGANQSYIGRNVGQDVVSIQATGSGSGRSDLIVARVEDPFMAGEPYDDPADVTAGPYIFTRVIPNVSPSTVAAPSGSSSIALARIDIPANTGTITAGMIKDLRQLAQPRSLSRTYGAAYPGNATYVAGTKEAGDLYNMAPVSDVRPMVQIPAWATHVDMTAQAIGLKTTSAGTTNGACLVRLGSMYGPHINWDYSDQATGESNLVTMTAASIGQSIPTSQRGTTQQMTLRSRFDYGSLSVQTWSVVLFTVQFTEQAV